MASFPGQKAGAAPVAPTTPSNLTATALVSGTQISLQWNPSLDGDLSISYIISRCSGVSCTNFSVITTTVQNAINYLDSGLTQTTSYSYTVQGIDGAGNLSGLSNIATATTPVLSNPQTLPTSPINTGNRWPFENWAAQIGAQIAGMLAPIQDLTAPSIPSSFVATAVSGSEIDLSWTASTDPDDAVSRYNITRNPGGVNIIAPATATSLKDTGLNSSTTYTYTISATDTNFNTSATASASATTQFVDTTPPSIPANFLATAVSASEIDLTWTASTDPDDAVSVYTITRNPGNVIIPVNAPATSYHDIGLTASTNYVYTISATDQHNNTSNTSSTSATTQAGQVSSFSPNFPRVGFMGIGTTTDNYYGNVTVTVQRLGSVPILSAYGSYNIFVTGADFEGWSNNGSRDRQVLVTNIKNSSTASLGTKVMIYGKYDSFLPGDTSYQTWQNVVTSLPAWTLYNNSTVGSPVPTANGASHYVDYAENSSGQAFGGNNSQGETPAQFSAHYQFYKSLNKNRTGADASRFAAVNAADAATNMDAIQIDNQFVDPRVNADWQRNGTTSTSDNGSYQGIWSDILARGQFDFFSTLANLISAAGQTQWLAGNMGDYGRADAGNTLTTAGVMKGVLNYSFFESAMGKSFSIETQKDFPSLLNDYFLLSDFLKDPNAVMLNYCLPDGGSAHSGNLPWSTTQTALNGEFQWARYMITSCLLGDGYCAIQHDSVITGGVSYRANGVDLTWYDENDNAGAGKGFLGQAIDGRQPNIRTWYNGTTIPNVYAREYANGLAICVAKTGTSTATQPTGTVTISGAQLGIPGRQWKLISGTQAPSVNTGATVGSAGVTLQASRDGLILLKVTIAPLAITTTSPLSAATAGTAYSNNLAATGGVPPYTWALVSASPNVGSWITVSSAGVLSGTPTTAETESIVIKVTDSVGTSVSKTFSLTVNAAGATGFLAAGHFVAGPMPLLVVYPRPDSETGVITATAARHRLAYYDGVQPVQFECPVRCQGGTRPHVFQIIAGPAWLKIGAAHPAIGGDATYGIAYGIPTAAIPKSAPVTVTVRVLNQDHTFLDVSFTLATSSSTADFVFTNSGGATTIQGVTIGAGSDTTGTGTISAPFASLNKIMGTSVAQVTFPGSRCYMVGNQTWPVQASSTYAGGFGMDNTHIPVVYMTLPGANLAISASNVQLFDQNTNGFNDLYFSGSITSTLSINGGPSQPPSEHTFELYNVQRAVWWKVAFTNPVSRATDGNNCNSIFCSNSGVIKNNYLMLQCSESGRTGATGSASVDMFCTPFSVHNLVIEQCTATGNQPWGVYIKDSNQNVTVAYCMFQNTNNEATLLFGGQTNNSSAGNCEACYNYIHGVMFFDFQAFANNGAYYSYRNTIYQDGSNYAYAIGDWGPSGTGPYSSNSDVLIAKTLAVTTSAAPITVTNGEVQAFWGSTGLPPANNPINPSTGNLVNVTGGTQWRTLWLGKRGWEIV